MFCQDIKLDFPKRYLTKFNLKYGKNLQIKNYLRAGIFPFFRRNGKLFFILSVFEFNESTELSDFAGKREETDTCWKQTASRELYEESAKLFKIEKWVLNNSNITVYDGKCVYTFIEITSVNDAFIDSADKHRFDSNTINNNFRLNQSIIDAAPKQDILYQNCFMEMKGIKIVDEDEMYCLLRGETIGGFKLWNYIRLFFSHGKNWPILKEKMKINLEVRMKKDGIIEYYPCKPTKVLEKKSMADFDLLINEIESL